jgi:hypothetical protein
MGLPTPWDEGADLLVRPWFYTGEDPPPVIRTAFHTNGGIRAHREGYMVNAASLEDIFTPFGVEWTEIVLNWPDQNREIFWDELMLNRIHHETEFQWLRMPEDGHNEEIVAKAEEQGYYAHVEDGWLHITR